MVIFTVTLDKWMQTETDQAMEDSKRLVVPFGKATGATMATYSMGDTFTKMVTSTLVP